MKPEELRKLMPNRNDISIDREVKWIDKKLLKRAKQGYGECIVWCHELKVDAIYYHYQMLGYNVMYMGNNQINISWY